MACPKGKIKLQFLGIWTPSFMYVLSFFNFLRKGINKSLCLWKGGEGAERKV